MDAVDALYVVVRGHIPGLYESWADCEKQINGYDGSFFAKFSLQKWKTKEAMQKAAFKFQNKASIKPTGTTYYAVARGNATGIFFTQEDCDEQIKGVSFPRYKKFDSIQAAADFIEDVTGKENQENLNDKFRVPSNLKLVKDFKRFQNIHGFRVDEESFVHVYTDGSCFENGKRRAQAGFGVFFDQGHPQNVSAAVNEGLKKTNNVGELLAVAKALRIAQSHGLKKLMINTDSKYVIRCFMYWAEDWKAKGWKTSTGTLVENKAIIEEIDGIISTSGINLKWNYVPGHKGFLGNVNADQLAKAGARGQDNRFVPYTIPRHNQSK